MTRIHVRGSRRPIAIEVDSTRTCAYVRMSRGAVRETSELELGLLADFDGRGRLVGFEVVGGLAKARIRAVIAKIRSRFGTEAAALDPLVALTS